MYAQVKMLFKMAAEKAPSIIFIGEGSRPAWLPMGNTGNTAISKGINIKRPGIASPHPQESWDSGPASL